ncbi:hypothetical protein [Stieleria varia]|uniref:Uncharacterized protein n=1 Tax=Stieleria varia TaxID=2528005 RepID=A0A5C6AZP6_9BACT|nr:hypothetical protein [Stieleria varia]TWU04496.1 hypothetical protein Pla52n_25370 [Stieleria varia]
MPRLNVFSRQQPDEPFDSDVPSSWSLPLGEYGGIHFYVSYAVFVAAAVLTGLVVMIQNRPGNADLPLTALIAVGIWTIGWIVQVGVHLVFHFGLGIHSRNITVGILGVESPNRIWDATQWKASTTVAVASTTLAAVFGCGLIFFAIHAITHSAWTSGQLMQLLRSPGFGLGASESLWLAGTWLCWVQVLCQLFPLSRNQGRALLMSVSYLAARETDEVFQTKLARRLLQLVAISTLLLAMATMAADQNVAVPRWPLLVFLSVLLWVSCRSSDLRDSIVSFHMADSDYLPKLTGGDEEATDGPSWVSQLSESIRMRKKRRLAREALRREREEADDESRLDEVLQRLGEKGRDSLSDSDRALLKRVSENLRRQKESGN